jgi:hypothetical protein
MNKQEALDWCKENEYLGENETLVLDSEFGYMVNDGDPVQLIACDLNKLDNKCPCENDRLWFKSRLPKTTKMFWNMYNRHVGTRKILMKR